MLNTGCTEGWVSAALGVYASPYYVKGEVCDWSSVPRAGCVGGWVCGGPGM